MKIRNVVCVLMIVLFSLTSLIAKESADITVFRPGVNARDKTDPMVRAAAKYKEATGGKVTFIISDWGNWQSKVLQNMAAGNPIDVVFARDGDFPKFYLKGYLQPIDGLVDMNIPYLNKVGMEQVFKYEGKHYLASHITSNHHWMITYNKTLMDEEGIPESEQPLALYKAGKWNFDNLRKLSLKLMKQTDGVTERYGIANWYTRAFVYLNGSSMTTVNGTENKLNFNDQRMMEALTFLETAKKEGWYCQTNEIAATSIQKRTSAMLMGREYDPSTILKETRDELCYVPLPVGPGAKGPISIFETDGYGIGNGSDSPTYAGKYIEFALAEWYEDDMNSRKTSWPQECVDMHKDIEQYAVYLGPTCSPIETVIDKFLGEIVWTGNSPATAIAGYTAEAEMLLADANKPMEKLERLPFKEIKVDFENKKTDYNAMFPLIADNEAQVALSVTKSKKDAINGKGSLKIVMTPAENADGYVNISVSNPEMLGVVGWRSYKITFTLKALKTPGEDAIVYAEAYSDDINKWGWISKKVKDANTNIEFSGYINDVNMNGKFGIRIGARNISELLIDDIIISEK